MGGLGQGEGDNEGGRDSEKEKKGRRGLGGS